MAGRRPDKAESRVLLVGAGRFDSPLLSDIPSVVKGLTAVRLALTDPQTGVFSGDPSNCRVLPDPARQSEFFDAFFASSAEASDVLLVYYAGHGLLDQAGYLHLAVAESKPRQPVGNSVEFDKVKRRLETCPARLRILILDCCYSGQAVGRQAVSPAMDDATQAVAQIVDTDASGMYVLTSADREKESRYVPDEPYTVFTGALLRALAPDPERETLLDEIYPAITGELKRRRFPEPQTTVGNSSGNLVVRLPGHGPDVPSTATAPMGRRRTLALTAGAAVVVVAVVVWWAVVNNGAGPTGGSGATAQPAPTTTASTTTSVPLSARVVPATDPCALMNTVELATISVTNLVPDVGGMASCRADVGDGSAEVTLTEHDSTFPRPNQSTRIEGPFAITDDDCDQYRCGASIIPADAPRFGIAVNARGGSSDVRRKVRDVLVASVVRTVASVERLPSRRPPPDGSVTTRPACDLLSDDDLAMVSGLSDRAPNPLFADWSCEWGNPNAGAGRDSVVGLGYGRGYPTDFTAGCERVGGRPLCVNGEVEADGRSACVAYFPGVDFVSKTGETGETGEPRVEIVVRNRDPNRVDTVCSEARTLAEAAIGRI